MNKNYRSSDSGVKLWGLLAEFETPEALIHAAISLHLDGLRELDAYTPYPVEGLAEAIGFENEQVALLTLLGGIGGGVVAFSMQWYSNVIDYPINVGGRPYFSWPAFIPITFELTVLGAALCTAFGMLIHNRLPRLWHPLFSAPTFERASRDRFFLGVKATDPLFNLVKIRLLLESLNPLSLVEVPIED